MIKAIFFSKFDVNEGFAPSWSFQHQLTNLSLLQAPKSFTRFPPTRLCPPPLGRRKSHFSTSQMSHHISFLDKNFVPASSPSLQIRIASSDTQSACPHLIIRAMNFSSTFVLSLTVPPNFPLISPSPSSSLPCCVLWRNNPTSSRVTPPRRIRGRSMHYVRSYSKT